MDKRGGRSNLWFAVHLTQYKENKDLKLNLLPCFLIHILSWKLIVHAYFLLILISKHLWQESVTDLAERELEQKNWMSETKPLKTKGKRVGTRSNELSVSGISNSGENKSTGNKDDLFSENSSLKHDISKMSWEEKEEVYTQDDGTQLVKMGTDLKIVKRNSAESVENEHSQVEFTNIDDDDDVIEIIDTDDDTMKHKRAKVSNHYKKKKNMVKVKQRAANINTPLPQGIILKKAALTGLPPEDVSHASRFLEFCEAVAQVKLEFY